MDIRNFFGTRSKQSSLTQLRHERPSTPPSSHKETMNKKGKKDRRKSKGEETQLINISSDDAEHEWSSLKSTKTRTTKRKKHVIRGSSSSDGEEHPIPKRASREISQEKKKRLLQKDDEVTPLDSASQVGSNTRTRGDKKSNCSSSVNQPTSSENASCQKSKNVSSRLLNPVSATEFFSGASRKVAEGRKKEATVASSAEKPPCPDSAVNGNSSNGTSQKTATSPQKARSPLKNPTFVHDTEKAQEATSSSQTADLFVEDPHIDVYVSSAAAKEKQPKAMTTINSFSEVVTSEPHPTDISQPTASTKVTSSLEHEQNEKNQETPNNASEKQHKASVGADYHRYLHRGGPQHLGEKEIPTGAENCLDGLTFVLTGVLDSLERDDAKTLIERYAGKVTTSISRKTSYIVVGTEVGVSKIAKAKQFGTSQLDEDGLFNLLRTLPAKADKHQQPPHQTVAADSICPKEDASAGLPNHSATWVDKYRPTSVKEIIGQHGEKSPLNKLIHWLRNWHTTLGQKGKGRGGGGGFWNRADDGSSFKASLLSGPPGIGKTTSAQLACNELGLHYVEMNASDTRNKKSLEQFVSQMTSSRNLSEFFGKNLDISGMHKFGEEENAVRHVLIMDEVDGMSGNEDRAGMQELIVLIKRTQIPIICICNDRQSQKIRSLANYCFDLRFSRPRTEQIRARLMTIAYQEGLNMSSQSADQLIEGAGHDIRQVVQRLSLMAASQTSFSFDEARAEGQAAKKDLSLNVFEAARQLMSTDGSAGDQSQLAAKMELFFMDYSLMPLFVQENYVNLHSFKARTDVERLKMISSAADLISQGDQVEALLRSRQSWTLLTHQAMFSAVLPSLLMNGHLKGMLNFPSWLGKNSTRLKRQRQLQLLSLHMSLRVSASTTALETDYIPLLRTRLVKPLLGDSVSAADVVKVLETYEAYDLTKEDADSLFELALWPGQKDPMTRVAPKTKAAVTRAYKKEKHLLPYSGASAAAPSKRGQGQAQALYDADGNPLASEADDSQPNSDDDDGANKKIPSAAVVKAPAVKKTSKAAKKPRTKR